MKVTVTRSLSGLLNGMPFPECGEHDLVEHEALALISDGYAVEGWTEKVSLIKPEPEPVKRGPGRPRKS